MDDYSALNQIKLFKQSSIVSSQLDIELLVLHLLEIDLRSKLESLRESISYRTVKAPIAGKVFDLG